MRSEQAPADQGIGQSHKGFVQFGTPFIATTQATELMQPGQSSFDHPARDAQSAAMWRVALGQYRLDTQRAQPRAMQLGVVGSVALHPPGSSAGSSASATHGWNGLDQGFQLGYVMGVGTGQDARQRHAACVSDQVMFAARF